LDKLTRTTCPPSPKRPRPTWTNTHGYNVHTSPKRPRPTTWTTSNHDDGKEIKNTLLECF